MFSFDELNILNKAPESVFQPNLSGIYQLAIQVVNGLMPENALEENFYDELIDLYLSGMAVVNTTLNSEVGVSSKMHEAIEKKFDGKGFRERLQEYSGKDGIRSEQDISDTIRVLETEAHRVFETAVVDTAEASGKQAYKTWHTMKDDRVRESHDYLEGMKIPADSDFFTWDGDHAPCPGLFENPANNCNCRCWLEISE